VRGRKEEKEEPHTGRVERAGETVVLTREGQRENKVKAVTWHRGERCKAPPSDVFFWAKGKRSSLGRGRNGDSLTLLLGGGGGFKKGEGKETSLLRQEGERVRGDFFGKKGIGPSALL